MGSELERKVEIFFLPAIMARGHMIPMVDTARLFATLGASVTIITTIANATLFQTKVDRDCTLKGRHIRFKTFKLLTEEVGLPDGIENNLTLCTMDMQMKLAAAIFKLREPIEKFIEESRPDCIISDMFFTWTADVGQRLGIPRILYQVTGLFPICCEEILRRHAPHEKVDSDTTPFPMPGLPDPYNNIQFTRLQIPESFKVQTGWGQYLELVQKAEEKSYGVMFNTFYDLESDYAEYYKNDVGRKIWLVGPVYLFNNNEEDKAERGEKNSLDGNVVMKWLNSKPAKSVIYVSFGSHVRMSPEQFQELAYGLESSGHNFLWVARDESQYEGGQEEGKKKVSIFPDGFEERVEKSGKGFIVKSWAPQLLILEHPSVGGFLTHCGWNSTVEGIGAGLPVATWPLGAEQFFIESLLCNMLRTGIRVGNEEWMFSLWDPKVTVGREKVEAAVKRLMAGGDEIEEMRKRAKALGEKAKKALEEGGSSHRDAVSLINELKSRWSA